MAHLLAGSDVRYEMGDEHRLSGLMVPDLTLDDGRRVAELLHEARPVLLDLAGGTLAPTGAGWADRMNVVNGTIADEPFAGMLIRPDGYVAWAADTREAADLQRLRAALQRWCGLTRLGKRRPDGHRDVRQRQPGGVHQRRMGGQQFAHLVQRAGAHLGR